ncbi:MAG: hypothetical protein WAW92_02005 [Minisyncoccia bacterium]
MFVREALDHDHALYLANLIDAGVVMKDRIWSTPDLLIIDGRHRREAFELAGHKSGPVDFYKVDDEADLIAAAYRANTGGSKPPTIADTEHTIGLLLEKSVSMRLIGDMLGLPASIARKYATEVKSRQNRAKLVKAAAAVTEGNTTVAKAAEQYEVDPVKLKEMLTGTKERSRHGSNGIKEMQRTLTKLFHSLGMKNASLCRKMIEKFEDGDMSSSEVLEVFAHLEKLQSGSGRVITDWKARFAAKAGINIKPKRARKAA